MNISNNELLSKVDHTLLKQDATWAQIQTLCDEAVQHNVASICINPAFIKRAASYLNGRIPICTVIGFPLGANTTHIKVQEALAALSEGAVEFDMVINISMLKQREYEAIENEIREIKKAVGEKVLKVIIETCLLTDEEKEKMCDIVCAAQADYIKTSTGFSTAGATFDDIALFNRCVNGRCKIKAAGGIRTREDMVKFVELGASRLGTSSAIKILNSEVATGY